MSRGERMLPGDYTRKLKYEALDDTKKDVQSAEGFFTFPEALKGKQETHQKDFLVFYFDDSEQYKEIREFFEIESNIKRSHPKLDAAKLYDVVVKHKKYMNQ